MTPREIETMLVRDVCELPGDQDPDADDTLILSVGDLECIAERIREEIERAITAAVARETERCAMLVETVDFEWTPAQTAAAIRRQEQSDA